MPYTGTATGTAGFSSFLQTLIRKELEQELLPTLPHLQDTGAFVKATFVKGSNSTMRFLRIPFLAVTTNNGTVAAGTAPWLTEGVAPAAQALAFGNEEFTAYQAGQRVEVTDLALDENPQDLMSIAAVRVARQAGATIDEYVGRIIAAGTNVVYAGAPPRVSRVTLTATDTLTGTLIRRVVQGMKLDSIPMFTDGTYHAIVSPAVVFDFEEDEAMGGWKAIGQYTSPGMLLSGELGKYAGVRFQESANARAFPGAGAAGVDVYSTVVFGPDFFAFGDWGNITTHYVAPGGHGDELAQVASLGWKCRIGAMLIDEAGPRYVRIESGASSI
ncbi:MAG: N4-gp56 family major capsid protein [Gemmatimonadetes bacterium]|nr:N4-gp56 family major capsid protein [Gemmatimonadota bacterium]